MSLSVFLFENPPVTHAATDICSGSAFFCRVNYGSVIMSLISILITLAFSLWVVSNLNSRRPGKFQMVFELLIDYTRGLIRDTVGVDALFILPLALTIFFYILIANWVDALPIPHPFAPANTDINQTAAMAVVVFIAAEAYSIQQRGLGGFLHHLTRPFELPLWARVIFVPLNVIEEIAKPLTLSLRLMGNIFGGIVMLWVLTVLLIQVPLPGIPYGASVLLVAVWKLFDVFVIGSLQAFIFFLLTIIYFGQAREGLDEHAHGHADAATPAAAHSH